VLYALAPIETNKPADRPTAALGPSRRIVYKMAALFSIDAFAGGFAVQSLVALWLFDKFGMSLSEAGFFFFWSGVLAAFSLGRMKFWGSGILAAGIFLTYLVPDTLLFIPLFQIVRGLDLLNSYWGMVLVYPTLTVPFCTWIMIGYFASIPRELDEAALIDGANYRQVLLRVFIPVALPGVIAATIFAFTVSWAQFLYPLAFTTSTDQLVLPVGIITSLIKGDVFNWGQIMTGALLGAAPPLIIYAFLMDYYIAGLTAGATKG